MKYYIIQKNKEDEVRYETNFFGSLEVNDELVGISSKEDLGNLLYGYKAFTEDEFNKAVTDIQAGKPVSIHAKESTRLSVVNEAEGRRFRGTSILEEEITQAGEYFFTYVLEEDREIDGMRFKAYGAMWNDKISMSVHAKNENDEYVEVDNFVTDWHLDEPTLLKVYRAKLKAGMAIVIKIDTSAENGIAVWCDAFLHEYPA